MVFCARRDSLSIAIPWTPLTMAYVPLPSDQFSNSPRAKDPASQLPSCPRCAAKLEEVYAATGQWLNWVREIGTLDGALWKGDKLVSFGAAATITHIPGLRCRSCGLVVLHLATTQKVWTALSSQLSA